MRPPSQAAELTDRMLWQRAADGDRDAFGVIFDRHSRAVYNHLFRLSASWSEAEDLTSAVFLAAWRRRAQVSFEHESALPWLLGVAGNCMRNARRSLRRRDAALARIAAEPTLAADHADTIAAQIDSERQMTAVRAAIAGLPRHQREVIELCTWSGLDERAAAAALGVPAGTVKSRLHRARQALAARLATPADPAPAPRTEPGQALRTEPGPGLRAEPGQELAPGPARPHATPSGARPDARRMP
ncbi:MAG TPA: sigma-70 family RNA polymerase sigma factor [Streptosporangiaceae bacterium]|jgi:RNA polymerase sigma-70 factor (ECF subfamily)